MNDPLYDMSPDAVSWWFVMADEAEDLYTAIVQDDAERRDRKIAELHAAFHKMDSDKP